jgi:endonuclease YncB( thermonuclease family)
MRRFLQMVAVCVVPLAAAVAQQTQRDFSKDPCGDPRVEDQSWAAVEGRVTKILDGRTVAFEPNGSKEGVTVYLAGISIDGREAIAESELQSVRSLLLDKDVRILVSPDEWRTRRPPTETVSAVILIPNVGHEDVALLLLSQGLAHFKSPRAFTMSRYTKCRYQRAEAEARSLGIGLWRDAPKQ